MPDYLKLPKNKPWRPWYLRWWRILVLSAGIFVVSVLIMAGIGFLIDDKSAPSPRITRVFGVILGSINVGIVAYWAWAFWKTAGQTLVKLWRDFCTPAPGSVDRAADLECFSKPPREIRALATHGLHMPSYCPCCGRAADSAVRLVSYQGGHQQGLWARLQQNESSHVDIEYCSFCINHAARWQTVEDRSLKCVIFGAPASVLLLAEIHDLVTLKDSGMFAFIVFVTTIALIPVFWKLLNRWQVRSIRKFVLSSACCSDGAAVILDRSDLDRRAFLIYNPKYALDFCRMNVSAVDSRDVVREDEEAVMKASASAHPGSSPSLSSARPAAEATHETADDRQEAIARRMKAEGEEKETIVFYVAVDGAMHQRVLPATNKPASAGLMAKVEFSSAIPHLAPSRDRLYYECVITDALTGSNASLNAAQKRAVLEKIRGNDAWHKAPPSIRSVLLTTPCAEHQFDGCTCLRCGEIRNAEHTWEEKVTDYSKSGGMTFETKAGREIRMEWHRRCVKCGKSELIRTEYY